MTIATTEPTVTGHEAAQVDCANASSGTPVAFADGFGCSFRARTAGW